MGWRWKESNMMTWTKTTDRLPPYGLRVLGYWRWNSEYRFVTLHAPIWEGSDVRWTSGNGGLFTAAPTFWMVIESPYEERKRKAA